MVQANEFAGRLFSRRPLEMPFDPSFDPSISAIRQFGIGMVGSSTNQHASIAGLKTVGQITFFKYSSTALAKGPHNRIPPQAYYYGRPGWFLGRACDLLSRCADLRRG
jgi:hypothetical protein